MSRYEYFVDRAPIERIRPLIANLNDMGSKGWRLVAAFPVAAGEEVVLIWERRPEGREDGHR